MAVYSVWRESLGCYDYYKDGRRPKTKGDREAMGLLSGVPNGMDGGLGVAPEDASSNLPMTASKIGSGTEAKGEVIHPSNGAFKFTPGFHWNKLSYTTVALSGLLAFAWWRRRKQ